MESCYCITDLALSRCPNWNPMIKTCKLENHFLTNKSTQMATLTITEKKARQIYPEASGDVKTLLEETFGKDFFTKKVTERILNWDDVLAELGITKFDNYGSDDEVAYRQLKLIAKALNEGWEPNWDNSNQPKWYPWFYMNSASGFSFLGTYCVLSNSRVSARLCFKTEELANHAAKTFTDIYKKYMCL